MPYTPRLPPRQHQLLARQRVQRAPLPGFALLMEMGTGKSKVGVDEWGERVAAGDVHDLLIIAPAGCYLNWNRDDPDDPGELLKHLDPNVHDRMVSATWRSGGGKKNLDAVRNVLLERNRPRVLVVNCEAVSVVDNAHKACRYFLSQSRGVIVLVDESTLMKGESIRTERIIDMSRISSVRSRRIMTGLVTPNSPLDLYWQFAFLDERILDFSCYETFKAHHAITRELKLKGKTFVDKHGRERVRRGPNPQVVVAYRNEDELNAKIAPHSYRVLKSECLDLPKKQYLPIRWVDLTDEQRRIYAEVRDQATSMLESQTYVTATMVLEQRLRLDQILCGHVKDEEGVIRDVSEKRTAALLELLQETMGKVIVWTHHTYSIKKIGDQLRREFGPASVAQFWGENRSTRGEDESRFKTDPRCRFMVATQAAGGFGNTWNMASLSVFYSNSDRLDHRLQAEDRVHRDGMLEQGGRGDYADLVAGGTTDVRKIKSLRRKIDMAALISGDPYQDWMI